MGTHTVQENAKLDDQIFDLSPDAFLLYKVQA